MGDVETSRKATVVPPRIIDRPRLTKLLDDAASRVLLLIAPAGYGKTTLARQWLSRNPSEALWYRTTRSAADVAVLASDLAHAASTAFGFQCTRINQRLRASSNPNDEAA